MRRDPGEHPNGLIDFALCSTIEHLRKLNFSGLSLNFAAFRSVLEGEKDTTFTRVERWALKRLSGILPIESLWSFNSKYLPAWLRAISCIRPQKASCRSWLRRCARKASPNFQYSAGFCSTILQIDPGRSFPKRSSQLHARSTRPVPRGVKRVTPQTLRTDVRFRGRRRIL